MQVKPVSWRIFLQGDLGLGKTSFVRHLLRALGVDERIKSPSFALMHSYPLGLDLNEPPDSKAPADHPEQSVTEKHGRGPIEACHFDFYRLNRPEDWMGVGLEAYFDDPIALLLVEWPEKARLPAWDLQLQWTWAAQEGPKATGEDLDAACNLSDEPSKLEISPSNPLDEPRLLSLRVRHDFYARAALKQGLEPEVRDFGAPAG
jgi:tRNA threonylcarbamoyladenosine biosynthesis protein TsaE